MDDRQRYWLGIGANLGARESNLRELVAALAAAGVAIEAVSALYESAPREIEDQPAFLNAALRVQSDLSPRTLLALIKAIEPALGRTPGVRYGPRMIDCDILMWSGGNYSDDELTIPHERLAERRFALVPLVEIDPGLCLPSGRLLSALAAMIDPATQPVNRIQERRLD